MAIRGYYLGCPGWGTKTWVGRLFPSGTKHGDFLARYAEVFNTVEGNTTFYALPAAETVARWRAQVPPEFRFCFKFPRAVTHEKILIDAGAEVAEFFRRVVEPLGDQIGTLMLQLPPSFDASKLARLRAFLAGLPSGVRYAVEFRHDDFYRGGPEEHEAAELLRERGVDLVIMDTRALHSSKSLEFAEVRGRKPAFPIVTRATASAPIVRFVPHEAFDASARFLDVWPRQLARWIGDGKRPYFFMHAPDDTFAPENAYRFHAMLRSVIDVGELPVWPSTPRQLGLL